MADSLRCQLQQVTSICSIFGELRSRQVRLLGCGLLWLIGQVQLVDLIC